MQQIQDLQKKWNDGARFRSLHASMSLAKNGVVLGAKTILVGRDDDGSLALDDEDAKIPTLLSVAYGRPVNASVLGKLRRASDHARAGDECKAAMEIALALPVLDDTSDAARRLFVADGLLADGVAPRDIWTALEFDPAALDALEKYNQDQPRVPAGSGRPSGRWTSADAVASAAAATAIARGAEWDTSEVAAAMRAIVARLAARLPGALGIAAEVTSRVAPPLAFASALLESPGTGGSLVQGTVRDFPDLTYSRQQDETALNIVSSASGHTILTLYPDGHGQFIDRQTGVAAHLNDDELVIGPPAMAVPQAQARADTKDPDMCPEPGLDLPGMIGSRGKRSKAYENYMKLFLNPGDPTLPGFGYQLPNPGAGGELVYYDDCHHETGAMAEYKGPGYARLINSLSAEKVAAMAARWIRQATRQIDASEERQIVWFFAEQRAFEFASEAFAHSGNPELARIRFLLVRPPSGNKWWKILQGKLRKRLEEIVFGHSPGRGFSPAAAFIEQV
jgi:hypothetical protein